MALTHNALTLPVLHFGARSQTPEGLEGLADILDDLEAAGGVGSDPYFAYGQSQGGAAWKAVELARKAKEQSDDEY